MAPHRKCKFQSDWLNEDEKDENGDNLMHYIEPDKNDIHRAFCTVCSKPVNVSTMGKAAILQHARGDIHKEKMKIKKGLSTQRQLPFQRVASDKESAEEVEVVHETGDKPRSDFSISVAKDPGNLNEPHSQQASLSQYRFKNESAMPIMIY